MQKMQVPSLSPEDPLEKEVATHSSILAWEIPWTEEPGRLYSPWGRKRVGPNLATKQRQQRHRTNKLQSLNLTSGSLSQEPHCQYSRIHWICINIKDDVHWIYTLDRAARIFLWACLWWDVVRQGRDCMLNFPTIGTGYIMVYPYRSIM